MFKTSVYKRNVQIIKMQNNKLDLDSLLNNKL